jgi:hypothetical protein
MKMKFLVEACKKSELFSWAVAGVAIVLLIEAAALLNLF